MEVNCQSHGSCGYGLVCFGKTPIFGEGIQRGVFVFSAGGLTSNVAVIDAKIAHQTAEERVQEIIKQVTESDTFKADRGPSVFCSDP